VSGGFSAEIRDLKGKPKMERDEHDADVTGCITEGRESSTQILSIGETVTIQVGLRFGVDAYQVLKQTYEEITSGKRYLFNMRNTKRIDNIGIGILFSFGQRAIQRKAKLELTRIPPHLAGLHELLSDRGLICDEPQGRGA